MRILIHTLILCTIYLSHALTLERYPHWFLFPAKNPEVVTGYSYRGNDAQTDAENMYCAYKACVVYGTLEIYNLTSENEWYKNSDYFYYYSPDSVLAIRGLLIKVDSFQTNILSGDYIEAFVTDSSTQLRKDWIDARSLPRPEWIERNFWQEDDFVYGVGMYTMLGNENDAWKTAEEQAVFTILNNLAVGMYKLKFALNDRVEGETHMEEISFLHLKYSLENIQVLERYPDLDNRLAYVLVRIPNSGIHSPYLRPLH